MHFVIFVVFTSNFSMANLQMERPHVALDKALVWGKCGRSGWRTSPGTSSDCAALYLMNPDWISWKTYVWNYDMIVYAGGCCGHCGTWTPDVHHLSSMLICILLSLLCLQLTFPWPICRWRDHMLLWTKHLFEANVVEVAEEHPQEQVVTVQHFIWWILTESPEKHMSEIMIW